MSLDSLSKKEITPSLREPNAGLDIICIIGTQTDIMAGSQKAMQFNHLNEETESFIHMPKATQ